MPTNIIPAVLNGQRSHSAICVAWASIIFEMVNFTENATFVPNIPREMTFNDDNLVSVIAYSCLFIVAAVGNLTVLVTLFKHRKVRPRINMYIIHLSLADLIVAFVMLPLETIWHITVSWRAGGFACRILMFFRAFGFYLSSFILVTISLDRMLAVVRPSNQRYASRRGKIMLSTSWFLSVVSSVPQVSY